MPEETEAIESTETVDNLETSTEVPEEPTYAVKMVINDKRITLVRRRR